MALFSAIAAAIGTAIGLTGVALTVFTAIGATVLSIGVSALVARSMVPKGSSGTAGGGRVQLPPATDNKIPVVYGSAFLGGPIIDAKISTNQKFMWYVVALAEHTDSTIGSGYTFDTSSTYYDGKKVQFGSNGVVTGLINNTTPAELDTKMNGKIYIWLFTNGSSSGINTGGQSAIDILSDASTGGGIPVGQRWTVTDTMTNCAFAIVRVEYNEKADTTSLGALMCNLSNSITRPGEAIKDYMLNTRYGCAIPLSRIDTVSLTALDAYSDEIITYTGGTQERYRINGPVNTSNNCLDNLQILVDSCDSWLQYSELSAKWKVVINQSYTDYTTIDDLFLIDSSNLVGGINVAPINLNETYNELEVAYPNKYIKDQTDYQIIQLEDYQPGVMSPNEAVNKLNLDYPIINNAVQAKYLGIRRLLQSREDLTITFKTDYSGIQIEAGDVIRVKQEVYGWDLLNPDPLDPLITYGKLFRVASVAEEKYSDGSLGVSIGAFEYNDTIYADQAITDFQPDPNLGISDPNIIDIPNAPTVELLLANTIGTMEVTGTVPNVGLITNLNFNFGTDSNVSNHRYYTTVNNANGIPLVNNANFTIEASDLPANTYYWSLLARNQTSGVTSNASNSVSWGGQNVTTSNTFTACNASSSGTLITSDVIANVPIGGLVTITTGTGTLQANTRVANVVSNTQFNVNLVPTVALSNACISITSGGIQGNNIQANTITLTNINSSLNVQQQLESVTFSIPILSSNTVVAAANLELGTVLNQPFYLDGTTVGSSYYYPYAQGTSSTANGYFANSTAAFTPATAAVLNLTTGTDNWWEWTYLQVSPQPANNSTLQSFVDFQIVANNTTTVQICPHYAFTSNSAVLLGYTNLMETIEMQANKPVYISKQVTWPYNQSIDGFGYLIRNMNSGTRVTMVGATMTILLSNK